MPWGMPSRVATWKRGTEGLWSPGRVVVGSMSPCCLGKRGSESLAMLKPVSQQPYRVLARGQDPPMSAWRQVATRNCRLRYTATPQRQRERHVLLRGTALLLSSFHPAWRVLVSSFGCACCATLRRSRPDFVCVRLQ